jgi:uncharacterized protein (DUF362 family)
VAEDEQRHARVFRILYESLDDQDRLAGGASVEQLIRQIREVSEHFLPRAVRNRAAVDNPLGCGGQVLVELGQAAEDKLSVFRRMLDRSGLRERLSERARHLGKQPEEMSVAVKATFMLGYDRRDLAPLVAPELVAELATFLREWGAGDVAVIEGLNIYERFFQHRSVPEVAHYFGFCSPHYRLVDAAAEQEPHAYSRGMAQYSIARSWRDADFRISFSKVRSHPLEMVLLSVGNVEWVGGRCEEYLFLERQASRTTAVMMLLDDFPPHFAILDAYDSASDGLVGMMGCPRSLAPRRFYAGQDALAVDTVAARHVGEHDPQQSSLLEAASHWFGGWSRNVEVVGCDNAIADWRGPYDNEYRAILSFLAMPMYVLGSGRGALFAPEMDPQAFPPVQPPGFLLRLGRSSVRALLGLRLPRRGHRAASSTGQVGERGAR